MILGMDLSLRGPALVSLPENWEPGRWEDLGSYYRIKIEEHERGLDRLVHIVDNIENFVRENSITQVFTEEYAFSFNSRAVTGLAELGGAVKVRLFRQFHIRVQSIVASSARKLLFGKMHRMKKKDLKLYIIDQMNKMGGPFAENHDLCDAFAIANAGLSELGYPCLAQS
jgi:Holliday junction resolvasome RuvABC endonuclease subunit